MDNERMLRWLGPLAVGVIVSIIIGLFILIPNEPDQNAPAAEIASFFRTHGTRETWSVYIVGAGLVLTAFLISGLRTALRSLNKAHSWITNAAFAGGVIFLSGFALVGTARLGIIEAARNNHPTLAADLFFWGANVVPVMAYLGMAVMGLGFGAAVLTTEALPNWLGAVGIVIGLSTLAGPAGFIGVLATPIWFAILGFVIQAKVMPHEHAAAEPGAHRRARLTLRHHH